MPEVDLKIIEENYAKMPDWKLEQMATNNADGLRSEVFDIIKKELVKRNLDLDLMRGVEAQNKEHTLEEIDNYCEMLRVLRCPVCKTQETKLNATVVYSIKSFLFFSFTKEELKIACPTCMDKAHEKANLSNQLLGWWSLPWGVMKTPQYLFKNNKGKEKNHDLEPSDTLRSFVLENIGEIELEKDDDIKLQRLIANIYA